MAYGQPKKANGHTGFPFTARFTSECGSDQDIIDPGETIVMIDGAAWHVQCADKADYMIPDADSGW